MSANSVYKLLKKHILKITGQYCINMPKMGICKLFKKIEI